MEGHRIPSSILDNHLQLLKTGPTDHLLWLRRYERQLDGKESPASARIVGEERS
ncbi:hypothetical protein BDQ17DRAFT_1384049 [Cyathus striatus]|nr:hypothetical protein BDQ17DRAFT_1384049 [Cyathus striatus]